jgi:hypothetical protein
MMGGYIISRRGYSSLAASLCRHEALKEVQPMITSRDGKAVDVYDKAEVGLFDTY